VSLVNCSISFATAFLIFHDQRALGVLVYVEPPATPPPGPVPPFLNIQPVASSGMVGDHEIRLAAGVPRIAVRHQLRVERRLDPN
jgi:hypothetical protein